MYSIVTLTYDVHSHLCTTFAYLPISTHAHNIIIHGHSCILYSCTMYMVIHVLHKIIYTELLKTICSNTFKSIPSNLILVHYMSIQLNYAISADWCHSIDDLCTFVIIVTYGQLPCLTYCDPRSLSYPHIVVILAITITPFTR